MNRKISKLIAMATVFLSIFAATENGTYAITKERIPVDEFEELSVEEMYEYFNFSDEDKKDFADYNTDEEIKQILIGLYDISYDKINQKEETLPADGDSTNLKEKFTGTNLGIVYCKDENLIKVNGWQQIDGYWYHFTNYIMDSGWLNDNGIWYYLKTNVKVEEGKGQMQTGWINDGGIWYYLKSNGAMMSNGWLQINGTWYYFYSNGAMAVNTTIGSYYVNSNGAWVK